MSVRVSVVMPVFNAMKYLRESIESVLNQSYRDLELLVVNDASTDGSKEIILEFVGKDDRVRYFENSSNVGVSESSNRAIREAQGVFIAKQDADDISLPQRLATLVDFLEHHPEIDLVASAAIFFEDEGKRHWVAGQELSHDEIRFLLLLSCPIMNPTLMVRRDFLFRNDLFYNPRFQGPEDYDLFCRAVQLGKLHSLEDVLLKYRIHDSVYRLNHASRKTVYKSGTAEIRSRYFDESKVNIDRGLLATYEDLFYNDISLNSESCFKTVHFYLKILDYVLRTATVDTVLRLRSLTRENFYNSFYQFSRIGLDALVIYFKYGRENLRMTPLQECRFALKCMLKSK